MRKEFISFNYNECRYKCQEDANSNRYGTVFCTASSKDFLTTLSPLFLSLLPCNKLLRISSQSPDLSFS